MIAGLLRVRRLSGSFILLYFYFCIDAIVEGWGFTLALQKQNNLWLYSLSVPILGVLWMAVLTWWTKRMNMRVIFVMLALALVALSVVYRMGKPLHPVLDDLPFTFFSLIVAFGCAAVLYELSEDVQPLFDNPVFWIAGGALMYYTVTSILFSISKFVVQEALGQLYHVQAVLSILANAVYSYALLCKLPRKT